MIRDGSSRKIFGEGDPKWTTAIFFIGSEKQRRPSYINLVCACANEQLMASFYTKLCWLGVAHWPVIVEVFPARRWLEKGLLIFFRRGRMICLS